MTLNFHAVKVVHFIPLQLVHLKPLQVVHLFRCTQDDNVGFSLSSVSMLYFNPRTKMYINNHCSFL